MKKRQHLVWYDIDVATRAEMAKCFAYEREQIVGMLTQITIDMDHFNDNHPGEEPLKIVLDFSKDVPERLAGMAILQLVKR